LGRNITHKVSNLETLYYATSNILCFCATWQNGETRKLHFFAQMPEFRLLDFFNLLDSRLILMLLYDSPNLVVNAFSSGLFVGHGSGIRRKEVESTPAVGLCCTHNALVRCLPCVSSLARKYGKTKHHLIFYFLSNTCAKDYRNRMVYVKNIASQRRDVFLRHSV